MRKAIAIKSIRLFTVGRLNQSRLSHFSQIHSFIQLLFCRAESENEHLNTCFEVIMQHINAIGINFPR